MILVFENSTLGGKHVLFEGVGSLRVHMLAGRLGFEPRYADPESAVLPLDDLPMQLEFYHKLRQKVAGGKITQMAIVIVEEKPTKEDIVKARKEFPQYIKITADLEQEIIAIGGEYHADAEKILVEKYNSQRSNIWGGGYNITLDIFEVNAIINLHPGINDSTDILDPDIRNRFLELVKKVLGDIKSLL